MKDKFVKQQYGKVGRHSVTKVCSWTKRCLRGEGHCYKHHFYGISTGQCLEMSPILICNQRCKHCWRDQSLFTDKMDQYDDPELIIDGCIEQRKKLLIGFKGNENVDQKKVEEFLIPKQAAISLTGEPCLYPKLPELIEKFYQKGFDSVFLVTNGTVPEMLKSFKKYPTNIYLSMEAWDQQSYTEFCKPLHKDQWDKINESMDILKQLSSEKKTKTVLRITCVKNFNMDAQKFKWVVEKMQPECIECKAYMFVGYSRKRLEKENMPEHSEVKEFSEKLAKLTGYKVENEQEESRVVLLEKD
jgi:tRNA wybutosine-synthesizing protein 1